MRIALTLGTLMVCLLSGCYSYSAARHAPPRPVSAPDRALAWPKDDPAALETLRAATPEQIFQAKLRPDHTLESIPNQETREMVAKPWYTIKRNEIVDDVLVRWYEKPDSMIGFDMLFTGFIPNGSVLNARDVGGPAWQLMQMRAESSRAQINKAWAESGIERDGADSRSGIDEGIPFRLPEELPENCKGIALHLWALGGNEYEQAVAEAVRSRGWLVVDIKPRAGATAEMAPDVPARIIALDSERDSLAAGIPLASKGESRASYQARLEQSSAYKRQGEIFKEISALRNPPIALCSESDVAVAAEELTRRIDRALVQNAQAARAVLETARRVHPSLRGAPVVVMGFSAGALSTPTVAAMLGPDVSEVIIIGGAANLLAVSQRSRVSHGGVRLTCDGKPPGAQLVAKLEEQYLARSGYDGYHAAPLLATRPVLVVDAGMDTWVPSDLGEILYQRLGQPDRLHMALGGHEMLFYFLPKRAAWIADWIDAHAASGGNAVVGSSGGGPAGSGSK